MLNLYKVGYVKILNSSVLVLFSCNSIAVNDLLMIVTVVLPDLVKQINYKSLSVMMVMKVPWILYLNKKFMLPFQTLYVYRDMETEAP